MEDLNSLYYFTQVVEHGGFAPAGRALDMPKSKLSRRIADLEERLGVRLLHRTSRHCSLTEIGRNGDTKLTATFEARRRFLAGLHTRRVVCDLGRHALERALQLASGGHELRDQVACLGPASPLRHRRAGGRRYHDWLWLLGRDSASITKLAEDEFHLRAHSCVLAPPLLLLLRSAPA